MIRPISASTGSPVSSYFSRIASKDRKSTRLNSSHMSISYAVFCLKKKKKKEAKRGAGRKAQRKRERQKRVTLEEAARRKSAQTRGDRRSSRDEPPDPTPKNHHTRS